MADIIQLNQEEIKSQLGDLVIQTVEDTSAVLFISCGTCLAMCRGNAGTPDPVGSVCLNFDKFARIYIT